MRTVMWYLGVMATLVLAVFVVASSQAASQDECVSAYQLKAGNAYKICSELKANNAEIQRIMGDFYFFGWHDELKQDYTKAHRMYKRAGVGGDIQSKYNVGVMLENGYGVVQDFATAYQWYLSAAKEGLSAAQLNVANMYAVGRGVEIDPEQAARWYLRAAKQGEAAAQYNIGLRYARGQGVVVNYTAAYGWIKLAYQRGQPEALESLRALVAKMSNADVVEAEQWVDNWKPILEFDE